jgi:hypothetical protein
MTAPKPPTPEQVQAILTLIADGTHSLRGALREAGIVPSTWYLHAQGNKELAKAIRKVRDFAHDLLLDDTVSLAEQAKESGDPVKIAGVKVEIWAIHERAKRLAPHRYGDRQRLEHTGKNGKPLERQLLASTPEERRALIEQAAKEAGASVTFTEKT